MFYSFLADVVVGLHVAYVGFVVVGLLLILVGLLLRWSWVRNPSFRILHLLAIVTVGLEAICGIDCPLTVWTHGVSVILMVTDEPWQSEVAPPIVRFLPKPFALTALVETVRAVLGDN